MSRRLIVVLLVMLVLVGAMGLKTVVTAHSDGSVLMAGNGGGGPVPPQPGPVPPTPWK